MEILFVFAILQAIFSRREQISLGPLLVSHKWFHRLLLLHEIMFQRLQELRLLFPLFHLVGFQPRYFQRDVKNVIPEGNLIGLLRHFLRELLLSLIHI